MNFLFSCFRKNQIKIPGGLRQRLSGTLAVFMPFLCALSLSLPVSAEPVDYQAEAEARKEMTVESNERENWPLGPQLGAQSAILMEAQTGAILYEKNIHEQLYPASITKILTALITMEQCPLDDVVTYSYEAVNSIDWQSDSNIGIKAGEQITVEQSLYGLLVGSANEVANALGEHISGSTEDFAVLMNQRAGELGCVDSHFANPNGIHADDHYTSAYDMALIAQAFFSNDLLCKMSSTASYTIPRSSTVSQEMSIQSKNQLLPGRSYSYEYLVGSKTGYTSPARQTLVSCAQKDGMKLVCVVLMEESPAQFTDTVELFNYGFSNFHMVNVADEDTVYTVGNNSFFETDNDVFGCSDPILTVNASDMIVLPNTARYTDTQSKLTTTGAADSQSQAISGENAADSLTAATIEYTYNGTYVGSASVEIVPIAKTSSVSGDSVPGDSASSGRIYINIKYVLAGILLSAIFLHFLFWFISVVRNYSFSRQHKERGRWKKRRRQGSAIDFDRYSKGPDDL